MLETPSVLALVHYVPPKGLRVIRPRHALMLHDYLRGVSRVDIALKYQVGVQTVTNLVNDPNVKYLIAASVEHSLTDLDTLLPKAVDTVRDILDSGTRRERLAAADKVFKIKNLYKNEDSGSETAEDVMRRIVASFPGATFNGPTVVQLGQGRD